jgi:hypothetical protein
MVTAQGERVYRVDEGVGAQIASGMVKVVIRDPGMEKP